MADVMMILGSYPFGLDTAAFQEQNRNTEWRWPAQEVFDSRPVLQFTGPGEDSITLQGVIFPEYWGGTGQLDALRALGDVGEPQILIDGRGFVLGEWVITGVSERQSTFAQAGVARRQEFSITLKRYDREVATAADAAALVAAATTATANLLNTMDQSVATAGQSASALAGVLGALQQGLGAAKDILGAVGNAMGAARAIQSAGRDAAASIKAFGDIKSLTSAQSAVAGLMSASSRAVQTATAASATINSAMGTLLPAQISLANSAMMEVNKLAITGTRIWSDTEKALRGFE